MSDVSMLLHADLGCIYYNISLDILFLVKGRIYTSINWFKLYLIIYIPIQSNNNTLSKISLNDNIQESAILILILFVTIRLINSGSKTNWQNALNYHGGHPS